MNVRSCNFYNEAARQGFNYAAKGFDVNASFARRLMSSLLCFLCTVLVCVSLALFVVQ